MDLFWFPSRMYNVAGDRRLYYVIDNLIKHQETKSLNDFDNILQSTLAHLLENSN